MREREPSGATGPGVFAAPLSGRRIVVTRAAAQARPLLAQLEAAGARAIALPTIRIEPPADPVPLTEALRGLDRFDGIIFTSANAVESFFTHLRRRREPEAAVPPAPDWVCAIGPATAAAVAEQGWMATVVPAQHHSEAVIEALRGKGLDRQRILYPRAAAGREVIPLALTALGAEVCLVEAYRTAVATESQAAARALFPVSGTAGADAVVFTSPSTLRHLALLLGDTYPQRLRGVTLAVIGPTTRQAAIEIGLTVAVEAAEAGGPGLVEALNRCWRR